MIEIKKCKKCNEEHWHFSENFDCIEETGYCMDCLEEKMNNTQKGENNMNTVEIHNKQFATAKDALTAAIEDLMQFNQDVIDELDESDMPGLAYGFKTYALRGLTDEVIEYFTGVVLGKEIETITDEIIEQTAWELADYSSTFDNAPKNVTI